MNWKITYVIDHCKWFPNKRVLVSSIPFLYTAAPPISVPNFVNVIGNTKTIEFFFVEHQYRNDVYDVGLLGFSLYRNDEVNIKLLIPWKNPNIEP